MSSSSDEKEIHDFLIKLSPEDSSSLDDLLASSTGSTELKLFTSLTPLLFQPDQCTIAQSILTGILQKKPSLLSVASSCIHGHITKLSPEDTFVVPTPLLQIIVKQLSQNGANIATKATEALQHLCDIRPPLLVNLLSLLLPIPEDSTVMIRYYTLMLQIVPHIHNIHFGDFDMDTTLSLWKPFIDGMGDENDPLLQMSLLEVLEVSNRDDLLRDWKELDPILYNMVGVNVKVKTSIDADMDVDMDGESNNIIIIDVNGPLHPFCAGAALRILAKRHINTPSPDTFVQILQSFSEKMSGEVEKIGFLDGISTYCQEKDEHLKSILDCERLLEEWLNLRRGQTKLKVVIINTVANVISSAQIDHDTDELCMRLYESIGTVNDVGSMNHTTTEMIMEYAKSQIVEMRFGAYELLRALAAHTKRGAHVLMRYGGFFEFLCNRSLEDVKEGKELKYDLVKAVWDSDVRGLLASDIVKVLEQVIEDGPYYVVKDARDVALE